MAICFSSLLLLTQSAAPMLILFPIYQSECNYIYMFINTPMLVALLFFFSLYNLIEHGNRHRKGEQLQSQRHDLSCIQ
jgi:hypothetical protein